MKPDLERIPFDHFQRYAGAASLVATLGQERKKVLEVGANVQRVLSDFLPNDQIVFSDLVPPPDGTDWPDFVQADAACLPFADDSFDAVVSLDVLEHMPVNLRAAAVAEMVRVATRLVVIACPTDLPWVVQAEARAQSVWGEFFDSPYPWLAEHEEFGLVDAPTVVRALADGGCHVIRQGHGDISVWLGMMSAHFAKEAISEFKDLVAAADYLYNHSVFAGDRSAETYREFFIGVRTDTDLDLVKSAQVLTAVPDAAAGEMVKSLGESMRRAALRIRSADVALLRANTQKAEAGAKFFAKEGELLARIQALGHELLFANTAKAEEGHRHAEEVRVLSERLNTIDQLLLAANTDKAEAGIRFAAQEQTLSHRIHLLEQELLTANTLKAQEGERHVEEVRALNSRVNDTEQALLAANTQKAEAGARFFAQEQALHQLVHELERELLAANTVKAEEGERHLQEIRELNTRLDGVESALTQKAEEVEKFSFALNRAQDRIITLESDARLLRSRVQSLLGSVAEANAEISRRPLPEGSEPITAGRFTRHQAVIQEFLMRRSEQFSRFSSALLHSIRVAHDRNEPPWRLIARVWAAVKLGPRGFVRRVVAYSQHFSLIADRDRAQSMPLLMEASPYQRWIDAQPPFASEVVDGPLISVVMPVFNTPEQFLVEAIESVQAQTYRNWELCIADDGSSVPHVRQRLEEACRRDARISVVWRPECGGIAAATNDAIASSSGEYLAFLDHDDLLAPEGLACSMAKLIETGADIVYSDHDCLSTDGLRCNPFFKPDWSPDLFLSQMYIAHLTVFRRSLMDRAGRMRTDCDGSQDYDLVLRCMEAGAVIAHVPRILYHWRQHSGSTASNPEAKPYAHDAGRRAIQHFLDAEQRGGKADDGSHLFCYDVRYPLPSPAPMATIIIPTRDGLDLLAPCVESILARTQYDSYEILVVDNGSLDPQTLEWFEQAQQADSRVRVLPADVPFNWSHLNNMAAGEARGEVLVFLNNDTEVLTPDWLLRLVENARRPEIAVCGPLLVYPDGTIQHAGVVLGLGGWADHVFKGEQPAHSQNLFVSPALRRNVLAVTGACMAISRTTFEQLGRFDETFIVCGSDVEICLRAHRRGLRNLYLPEVRLIHHESKTRDATAIPEIDFERSAEEYGSFRIEGDPLYNPNLDLGSPIPALRLKS